MEPNYPTGANTPSVNPYPQQPALSPEPSKKRWPLSPKLTIVLGVVLLLIALAIAAVLLNKGSSKNGKKDGGGNDLSSLYIQRTGYENVGDGIGDPLALISKPSGKTVQYGGTTVVQACTLITIKDVRDAGLKIQPNQLTGTVKRTYFDGVGPALLKKGSDLFLPFDSDSNHCQYLLEDKGVVEVVVYQPNYTNMKAVDYEVGRKHTKGADVNGFKTYQAEVRQNDPNNTSIFFRSDTLSAKLRIETADKTAKDKIIALLGQRLAQAPTAIEEFSYESPIFESKVVNACSLTDNTDFKSILGIDSGPLTEESLGSAVGVIQEATGGKLFNYVAHDCKRRSVEGSTKDKTLSIKTQTYETIEGAVASTTFEKTGGSTSNLQEISPVIGDESFYGDTAGQSKAIVIRKGRVIVHMSYYLPEGNNAITAAQRIQTMTPLAQAIADKLKSY